MASYASLAVEKAGLGIGGGASDVMTDAQADIQFAEAYKDVVTPKDPCEGLTGDSLAKCRNKQYETKSAGTGENTSTPKQEAPKDTSAYANLPDDYDSEIHKAGFDKDNKRVLKDSEGNTYAKYDATSNQWVHVDSVQDFG